jgi:outer membrane protein assembly factor BamB
MKRASVLRLILVVCLLFTSLGTVAFPGIHVNAQIATSAWPMFGHDLQHTRRSAYLGAQTDNVRWTYTSGGPVFSSPVIGGDGTLYFGSNDSKLYAVNPDGSLKWSSSSLAGAIVSSPAIASDGTVYVGSDSNYLYAFNPNGTQKWAFQTYGRVRTSPCIAGDGTVYVGDSSDPQALSTYYFYAINPNGTQKWAFQHDHSFFSSPALGTDGTIYVGSRDHTDSLIAFDPNGTLKWSYPIGSYVLSSPAIGTDGTVHIGADDGTLYAINPDGTLKWSYTTAGPIESSPGIGGDATVYVGSNDGKLHAINGKNGTLKWAYLTGEPVRCSPAIGSDGTIYFGSYDDRVYALNWDGTLKWSFVTSGDVYSSPGIASDGTAYVGAADNKLYAFGTPVNQKPTAVLTAPSPVEYGQSFTLSGSGSSDTAPGSIVEYRWTLTASAGGSSSMALNTTVTTAASSFTVIPDATTPLAAGSHTFRLVVVDNGGLLSDPSDLTVVVNSTGTAPIITVQPIDQTVNAGSAATFIVKAGGIPAPTVQWESSTNSGSSWSSIGGATAYAYTTPLASISMSGYQYRAVVSNSAGSTISRSATLNVNLATMKDSRDYINELVQTHVLSQGTGNSLIAKLNTSESNFGKKNAMAGVNTLGAFRNETSALIISGRLSAQIGGQLIRASQVQAAARLKNSGHSASEVGEVLRDTFGADARTAAGVLANVGYGVDDVATCLRDVFGQTGDDIFDILVESGFSLEGVCRVAHYVLGLTWDSVAEKLKRLLGEDKERAIEVLCEACRDLIVEGPAGLWRTIKEHLAIDAEVLAGIMKDRCGAGGDQAAQWLMGCGYSAPDIAQALKDVFNKSAEQTAVILKSIGCTADQVTQALKDAFDQTALGAAQILKNIGYTYDSVLSAIMSVFSLAWAAVVAILAGIF